MYIEINFVENIYEQIHHQVFSYKKINSCLHFQGQKYVTNINLMTFFLSAVCSSEKCQQSILIVCCINNIQGTINKLKLS